MTNPLVFNIWLAYYKHLFSLPRTILVSSGFLFKHHYNSNYGYISRRHRPLPSHQFIAVYIENRIAVLYLLISLGCCMGSLNDQCPFLNMYASKCAGYNLGNKIKYIGTYLLLIILLIKFEMLRMGPSSDTLGFVGWYCSSGRSMRSLI